MTPDDDRPRVIARPPLIYLGFLVLGLALEWAWPAALLPDAVRYPLGAVLVVAGVLAVGLAIRRFRAAGTSHQTNQASTTVVTDGLYRYSRNPIYLALALIYAGIAVAADSPWALALLIPTLVVVRYGVIAREEAYLEAKFGEPYRAYKAKVRRWL